MSTTSIQLILLSLQLAYIITQVDSQRLLSLVFCFSPWCSACQFVAHPHVWAPGHWGVPGRKLTSVFFSMATPFPIVLFPQWLADCKCLQWTNAVAKRTIVHPIPCCHWTVCVDFRPWIPLARGLLHMGKECNFWPYCHWRGKGDCRDSIFLFFLEGGGNFVVQLLNKFLPKYFRNVTKSK